MLLPVYPIKRNINKKNKHKSSFLKGSGREGAGRNIFFLAVVDHVFFSKLSTSLDVAVRVVMTRRNEFLLFLEMKLVTLMLPVRGSFHGNHVLSLRV